MLFRSLPALLREGVRSVRIGMRARRTGHCCFFKALEICERGEGKRLFCIRGRTRDNASLSKHLAVYIHTAPRTTSTGGHAIQGGVQRPTIMSTTLTQSRVTRRAKIHQTQHSALRLRLGPRVVPSPARSSRRAYIHIQARPTVRHPACAMTSTQTSAVALRIARVDCDDTHREFVLAVDWISNRLQ